MQDCFKDLRNIKADIVLAGLSYIFGLIFLYYALSVAKHPAYIFIANLALVTVLLYFILRRKLGALDYGDREYSRWIDLAYWVIFGSAVLVYVFRPLPYERPTLFFAMIAVASGIVAQKLIWREPQIWERRVCLLQIISIGILLAWSVTFMYPTLVGQDPWWHRYLTLRTIDGVINWRMLPVMNIIVAGFMKVCGIDYRIAALLSISLASISLDVLFIYLIGRRLFNVRIGLLAGLVLTVSNWHVFFAYWAVPNTLALTLLLGGIWSFIEWWSGEGKHYLALSAIFMLLMLFTHPLGTVWAGMFLFAVFISMWWCNRHFPVVACTIFSLYMGTVAVWWGLYTGHLKTLSYFIYLRFSPKQLQMITAWQPSNGIIDSNLAPMYTEMAATHPWQMLYGGLGMFLLFCLGAFGIFILARKITPKTFSLVLMGIASMVMGVVPVMFGLAMLEHRWWYFSEALLSIPVAVTIFYIAKIKDWLAYYAVAFLCFLLVLGLPANRDNGILAKDLMVRFALTREEIEAADYALDNCEDAVGMDAYYAVTTGHLRAEERSRLKDITQPLLYADFANTEVDAVVIRNEVANAPFGSGDGKIYRLNYAPYDVLLEQGFRPIFANDGAIVYKRY